MAETARDGKIAVFGHHCVGCAGAWCSTSRRESHCIFCGVELNDRDGEPVHPMPAREPARPRQRPATRPEVREGRKGQRKAGKKPGEVSASQRAFRDRVDRIGR